MRERDSREFRGKSDIYKPGEWNCTHCGVLNFKGRIECFKCKAPSNLKVREGEWVCDKCNLINFKGRMNCFFCSEN